MARRRRRRRARPSGGRVLPLALLVLALVAGGLVLARRPLAEYALHRVFAARGMPLSSISVTRLDAGGLVLARVATADGALAAERVEISLDLPRLDFVRIEGLRAVLNVAPDGTMSGIPAEFLAPLGAGGENAGRAEPPRRVEIVDARARLALAEGTLALRADGALALPHDTEGGHVPAAGRLALVMSPEDEPARRHGLGGSLRIEADADGQLHALPDFSAGSLALAGISLKDARLTGDLVLGKGGPDGTLALDLGPGSGWGGLVLDAPARIGAEALGSERLLLAPVRLTGHGWGGPVEVGLPGIDLSLGPMPRLTARGAALRLGGPGIALEDLDFDGWRDGGPLKARLVVGGERPVLAPVDLAGEVRLRDGAILAEGRLRAPGGVALGFSARHLPESGAGEARLSLPRHDLSKIGLAALLPGLGEGGAAKGSITATAETHWDAEGTGSSGELMLSDVDLELAGFSVARLNGRVRLDRLWPIATPPGQRIAFGGLDLGLLLTDGRVAFALDRDGTLRLDRAEFGLAGGRVSLRERELHPFAPPVTLNLDVAGVELAGLFSQSGISGLSGDGRLAGTVPVILSDKGIEIPQARLQASGSGRLAYAPADPPSALSGDDPRMKLAVTAMRDLRYRHLVVVLTRRPDGEAELGLSLTGSNPAVYGGVPVTFNVNLEGRLDEIARSALADWRVPDDIRQEMENSAAPAPGAAPPAGTPPP